VEQSEFLIKELKIKMYFEKQISLLYGKIDSLDNYVFNQKKIIQYRGKQIDIYKTTTANYQTALNLAKKDILHLSNDNQKLRRRRNFWKTFSLTVAPILTFFLFVK